MVITSYYKQEREEMLDFFPPFAGVVLEVGCGCGTFGKLLCEKKGAEVWGIEMSESAGREAELYLTGVFIGSFENFWNCRNKFSFNSFNKCKQSIFNMSFDFVVFNDVLEHLVDPWDVLQKCKLLLKPKGMIVASIPNVRYYKNIKKLLFQKDWEYVEQGILDRTHLRFFTKKSIFRMFKKSGFHICNLTGINKTKKLILRFLNKLMMNFIVDMLYVQFAVVVVPE